MKGFGFNSRVQYSHHSNLTSFQPFVWEDLEKGIQLLGSHQFDPKEFELEIIRADLQIWKTSVLLVRYKSCTQLLKIIFKKYLH